MTVMAHPEDEEPVGAKSPFERSSVGNTTWVAPVGAPTGASAMGQRIDRSADELRRDIERAMQDDLRLYAELRAQLERTREFVLRRDAEPAILRQAAGA